MATVVEHDTDSSTEVSTALTESAESSPVTGDAPRSGEAEAPESTASEDTGGDTAPMPRRRRGVMSRPGRLQLLAAVVILALITAVGVLAFLLNSKSDQLAERDAAAAATSKAQQVALDYANGAATMNYQDLPTWNQRLVVGTSPELKDKLTAAATSMEQVITPLQWTSTAQPIAAQVASHNGSVYVVRAFVNVTTKNAQAPDGVQSTATYTITLDSAKNWLITDVGGVTPVGPR